MSTPTQIAQRKQQAKERFFRTRIERGDPARGTQEIAFRESLEQEEQRKREEIIITETTPEGVKKEFKGRVLPTGQVLAVRTVSKEEQQFREQQIKQQKTTTGKVREPIKSEEIDKEIEKIKIGVVVPFTKRELTTKEIVSEEIKQQGLRIPFSTSLKTGETKFISTKIEPLSPITEPLIKFGVETSLLGSKLARESSFLLTPPKQDTKSITGVERLGKGLFTGAAGFGLSFLGTGSSFIAQPLTSTFRFGKEVITKPVQTGKEILRQVKQEPLSLAGQIAFFEVGGKLVSRGVESFKKTDIKLDLTLTKQQEILGVGEGKFRGKPVEAVLLTKGKQTKLTLNLPKETVIKIIERPRVTTIKTIRKGKLISELKRPTTRPISETPIKPTLVAEKIEPVFVGEGFERSVVLAERQFRTDITKPGFDFTIRDIIRTRAEATPEVTIFERRLKTGEIIKDIEPIQPLFEFGTEQPINILEIKKIKEGVEVVAVKAPDVFETGIDIRTGVGELRFLELPIQEKIILKIKDLPKIDKKGQIAITRQKPLARIKPREPGVFEIPSLPRLKEITFLKPSVSPFFILSNIQQQDQDLISLPKAILKQQQEFRQDQFFKSDIISIPKSRIGQRLKLSQIQDTLPIRTTAQTFLGIVPPAPFTRVPPEPPKMKIPTPPLISISTITPPKFTFEKETFTRRKGKQPKVFVPSVSAFVFDIKQPKFRTGGLFTGFEFRPQI